LNGAFSQSELHSEVNQKKKNVFLHVQLLVSIFSLSFLQLSSKAMGIARKVKQWMVRAISLHCLVISFMPLLKNLQ